MGEQQSQFEKLLLPHLDSAYNVAYWVLQSDRDAQAIVQEGFAQAWREFERSRELDTRVWLLSIIVRIAHTRIRTQDKHRKESSRDFGNALSRLPVEFREILVLHDLEGWTYRQLATGLEISLEAVASRLSMARRSLKNELGDAPNEGVISNQ